MATGNPFTTGQASPVMNFIAPDISAQQMQLTRQQQLADLLRQQVLAPSGDTQMVSGWAVKKSPMEGIAKLLQAYGSGVAQDNIDSKQLELGKAMQERMGGAFDSMLGGGAQTQGSAFQTAQTLGDATGNSGPPDPTVVQAVQQAQPQQSDQTARLRNAAKAAYLMGNPDLANKLIGNMLELTNEQKNNSYMGISGKEAGGFERAKRTKEGIMEYQPGNMAVNLATGERTVAPDFKSGTQGGFDANGNPIMASIPGSGIIAQMEGDKARAIAKAQAGYRTQKVDKVGGPVLMTDSQVVDEANGGNGGFPTGTRLPSATPTPAGGDRLSLMQRERADILTRPDSDPRKAGDLKAIDNEIARIKPKGAGIPLQDEGASAFSKEVNSKGAQALLDSRDKAKSANDELSSIYESRSAIKSGAFQGFGADAKTDAIKIAQGFGIPIDSAKSTNTDYLRSTLGKGMLDNAKKLGVNPTDADARRLDVIIGTIGKDPQAMSKLLDWREQQANKLIDQHNRDIESASQGGAKFPFDLRVTRNQDRNAAPAPAAAKTFNTLPNPAEYSGKRMKAPDGSIIRSNGKAWIKE